MLFLLLKISSYVFGTDRVLRILERLGLYRVAWELAAYKVLKRVQRDLTFCYTYEFGLLELQKARFAERAACYEWAWINASDALAVFKWKGAVDELDGAEARRILDGTASQIARERLEDLKKDQNQTHSDFLSRKEHELLKRMKVENRWAMTLAMKGIDRPRINERFP